MRDIPVNHFLVVGTRFFLPRKSQSIKSSRYLQSQPRTKTPRTCRNSSFPDLSSIYPLREQFSSTIFPDLFESGKNDRGGKFVFVKKKKKKEKEYRREGGEFSSTRKKGAGWKHSLEEGIRSLRRVQPWNKEVAGLFHRAVQALQLHSMPRHLHLFYRAFTRRLRGIYSYKGRYNATTSWRELNSIYARRTTAFHGLFRARRSWISTRYSSKFIGRVPFVFFTDRVLTRDRAKKTRLAAKDNYPSAEFY